MPGVYYYKVHETGGRFRVWEAGLRLVIHSERLSGTCGLCCLRVSPTAGRGWHRHRKGCSSETLVAITSACLHT